MAYGVVVQLSYVRNSDRPIGKEGHNILYALSCTYAYISWDRTQALRIATIRQNVTLPITNCLDDLMYTTKSDSHSSGGGWKNLVKL